MDRSNHNNYVEKQKYEIDINVKDTFWNKKTMKLKNFDRNI